MCTAYQILTTQKIVTSEHVTPYPETRQKTELFYMNTCLQKRPPLDIRFLIALQHMSYNQLLCCFTRNNTNSVLPDTSKTCSYKRASDPVWRHQALSNPPCSRNSNHDIECVYNINPNLIVCVMYHKICRNAIQNGTTIQQEPVLRMYALQVVFDEHVWRTVSDNTFLYRL